MASSSAANDHIAEVFNIYFPALLPWLFIFLQQILDRLAEGDGLRVRGDDPSD